MSLKTVSFTPEECIRCGGSSGPELSINDLVQIFLNQDRIPLFPEYAVGIVVDITQASAIDTARTYKVQYETGDLNGAVTELAECDIVSLVCTNWRDTINDWVVALSEADEPDVNLAYFIAPEDENRVYKLQATVNLRIPGVTVASYTWFAGTPDNTFDPSGLATDNITVIPDSQSSDSAFLGGLYGVIVTDSAGHTSKAYVYVNPTRIKSRYATTELLPSQDHIDAALNEGEWISSFTITSGDPGVSVVTITQFGTTATMSFDGPNVTGDPITLNLIISRVLP